MTGQENNRNGKEGGIQNTKIQGGGIAVELDRNTAQNGAGDLEVAHEDLMDALSLVIMMENDIEMLGTGEIYARVLKQVHRIIKNAQEELNLYIRRKQEK